MASLGLASCSSHHPSSYRYVHARMTISGDRRCRHGRGKQLLRALASSPVISPASSVQCINCEHVISSMSNLCLYRQNNNLHLSAKFEVPHEQFNTYPAESQKKKNGFVPFTLHCKNCDFKIGSMCKYGPNHELVYVFARDGVKLLHDSQEYSCQQLPPCSSQTGQSLEGTLPMRDVYTFHGDNPAAATLLQRPAMHATASRGPTTRLVSSGCLHPDIDPGQLTATRPRPHQVEVFVRACFSSSIVVLPTGSGKTLVAAMMVAGMRKLNPAKWVVLLTETCPLAEQQGDYLRREISQGSVAGSSSSSSSLASPANIQVFHGDNSTPAARIQVIGETPGVLVVTAGCFLGLLELGFDIQACSLLVFDEAHHATKDHPFSTLAKRLNDLSMGSNQLGMPHVLGLTASPVVSGKNMERDLSSLALSLDARFVVPRMHPPSREQYNIAMTEVVPLRYNEWDHGTGAGLGINDTLEDIPPDELLSFVGKSQRYIELRKLLGSHMSEGAPVAIRNKALRILVFAQRRAVAAALVQLLSADAATSVLQPALLVGQSGTDGMSWRQQQKPVLDKFRQGDIQLLVSTSVVEEGLDVTACDVVIRFDSVNSLRELIQSRGRVRKQKGRYQVLCSHDDVEKIKTVREHEDAMLKLVAAWVAADDQDGAYEQQCKRAVKLAMRGSSAAEANFSPSENPLQWFMRCICERIS